MSSFRCFCRQQWSLFCLLVACTGTNLQAENYKRLPPPGIELDAKIRTSLSERVGDLQAAISNAAERSEDAELWQPDVEVLVRAVRLALEQNLFFKESEPKTAAKLLDEAQRRLQAAVTGKRGLPLLGLNEAVSDQPQLLVGGFKSRIDDSIQPYGLVVPAGYKPMDNKLSDSKYRVDVWLHGRGDTKTEVPFLNERMTKIGQYAPKDTFVLHPFGRHCNAFKFAGETDVYESLAHLGTLIPTDHDRVAIRGFSMGGAGCWHLAVHDPGRWFAANPGAGFVDTIVYQGWTQETPFEIDQTQSKLLNWYDVLPWVSNLRNTNVVAYSGEVDKQRQAADRVVEALKPAGVNIEYVIGEGMGHKIDPASATKIESILLNWSQQGRQSPRQEIDFVTYTLRHHRVDWLQVTGLQEHWSPGRVRAKLSGDNAIEITTTGVTRLKLDFRDSGWPNKPVNGRLLIDGQRMTIEDWDEAAGIQCELALGDDWSVVETIDSLPRKRPGLQGPIDDAFCDRFVFVVPSRPATHGVVQRWIDRELAYAKQRWSGLMRGDVRVVTDSQVTADQIKSCHLICFGDFTSNRYLHSVASHFPIRWTRDELKIGSRAFDPSIHAAAFCFPNPRNPERYVVVNSGMTFREFSNVSNSRQIAMLPDWAVMDVRLEDDSIFPGKIVADGLFDEQWKLKP